MQTASQAQFINLLDGIMLAGQEEFLAKQIVEEFEQDEEDMTDEGREMDDRDHDDLIEAMESSYLSSWGDQ